MMKRLFILIALAAILLPSTHLVHAQVSDQTATVFFNEACQDCGELVQEMYPMLFAEYGYTLELHDYINERSNRALLTQTNDAWGVPFELQSHIETFIDDRLLIGGHVPEATIRYLLENPDAYDRLLVYQDAMHGEETEYRVWDFEGDIMTYVIDEPITTYLEAEPSSANTDLPRQGVLGTLRRHHWLGVSGWPQPLRVRGAPLLHQLPVHHEEDTREHLENGTRVHRRHLSCLPLDRPGNRASHRHRRRAAPHGQDRRVPGDRPWRHSTRGRALPRVPHSSTHPDRYQSYT